MQDNRPPLTEYRDVRQAAARVGARMRLLKPSPPKSILARALDLSREWKTAVATTTMAVAVVVVELGPAWAEGPGASLFFMAGAALIMLWTPEDGHGLH